VRRHSIFISYYNIYYYYYYYNTTVNGRIYAWTLRGVLLCARGVFWFSILGCTIIIINSCCALDAGRPQYSGVFAATTMGRDDHKTRPESWYVGIMRLCLREIERKSGQTVECMWGSRKSVCVTNYYDIFIISCIIIK